MSTTASSTLLLPFQPSSMTSGQLAAVSYLARYSGSTHTLYAARLRRWFGWCKTNGLDPLVGIQRAHVELYLRQLGDARSRTVGSILLGMRTSSLRIE